MSSVSIAPPKALLGPLPWFTLALGLLSMVLGGVLSGQAVDRELLLSTQVLLRDWPIPWAFLTWSGLGICGFVLLTSLSAEEPRRVGALLVALLIGGIVVHVMKRTLHVDRPATYFGPDHPVFQVIGKVLKKGSMPSGHSATAWAVAVLLVARERGHASMLRHLWWVLAALQALSRAVVGAHWPSDILVGSGMGLLLAPLAWRLEASARLGNWLSQPRVCKAVAVALPIMGLYLCLGRQGWVVPSVAQAALMLLCGWGSWRWWRKSLAGRNDRGAS